MLPRSLPVLAVTTVLALGVAACGGDDNQSASTATPEAKEASFPAGTKMAQLADNGSIKIGVKKDQPGIGFEEPGASEPSGFDIEVAKMLAAKLGIRADKIEWVETVSKNREPFLQNGTVDLVLASYSITPERRKIVGQAGPYYVTGQQLLVRDKDKGTITGPDKLGGKKVCSVTGSTSIKTVEEKYGAKPVPFATYSECVQQLTNSQVDAVTTDGAILLGYAAQNPDELEVVGKSFSEERYGVGYQKKATEMCDFINTSLQDSYDDGSWKKAFDATLGKSGAEAPAPPKPDPCPTAK